MQPFFFQIWNFKTLSKALTVIDTTLSGVEYLQVGWMEMLCLLGFSILEGA